MNDKLLENIAKNIKKNLIKEGIFEDYDFSRYEDMEDDYEEPNYFEEYEQNYPNSEFNPNELSKRELVRFCHTFGDFFFIANGLRGMRLHVASTEDQQMAIIGDICKGTITPTHEVDYLIDNKLNFEHDYVAVLKVQPQNDDAFYLVYEKPKDDDTYNNYNESKVRKNTVKLSKSDLINLINESVQRILK